MENFPVEDFKRKIHWALHLKGWAPRRAHLRQAEGSPRAVAEECSAASTLTFSALHLVGFPEMMDLGTQREAAAMEVYDFVHVPKLQIFFHVY